MEPRDPEVAVLKETASEEPERPAKAPKKGIDRRLVFVLAVAVILGAAVAVAVVLVKESPGDNSNATSPNISAPTFPDFPVNAPTPLNAPATNEGNLPVPTAPVSVPVSNTDPIPVSEPTATPVSVPTRAPTSAPTATPTSIPTATPTFLPTSNSIDSIRDALAPVVLDSEYLASSNTALEWLVATAESEGVGWQTLLNDPTRLVQQYSLLNMDLATQGALNAAAARTLSATRPRFARGLDECSWVGVTCANGTVTHIVWSEQALRGSIPENVGLLSGLAHLDLGENELQGSIPESIYNLVNLQSLYLHSNELTGSISESIANLFSLRNLYLSNNQLTGTLPRGIGSPSSGRGNIRPLRYLTVYNNNLSGQIPSGLNLRNLNYLDLGRNNFDGTIPIDWYEGTDTMFELRHLLLDYNNFSGGLTANFPTIGNGRLDQVVLNDNQFSGPFPGGWSPRTALEVLRIQNNQFTSVNSDLCIMSVFVGGELTDFRTDCSICSCRDIWCNVPYCTSA